MRPHAFDRLVDLFDAALVRDSSDDASRTLDVMDRAVVRLFTMTGHDDEFARRRDLTASARRRFNARFQ